MPPLTPKPNQSEATEFSHRRRERPNKVLLEFSGLTMGPQACARRRGSTIRSSFTSLIRCISALPISRDSSPWPTPPWPMPACRFGNQNIITISGDRSPASANPISEPDRPDSATATHRRLAIRRSRPWARPRAISLVRISPRHFHRIRPDTAALAARSSKRYEDFRDQQHRVHLCLRRIQRRDQRQRRQRASLHAAQLREFLPGGRRKRPEPDLSRHPLVVRQNPGDRPGPQRGELRLRPRLHPGQQKVILVSQHRRRAVLFTHADRRSFVRDLANAMPLSAREDERINYPFRGSARR